MSATSTDEIPRFYPIGTPGKPWEEADCKAWKEQAKVQRSYQKEVVDKLQLVKDEAKYKDQDWFEIKHYGALSHDPSRYPLVAIQSKEFDIDKPFVLVTGGVHGYETSGVQGAIAFCQSEIAANKYAKSLNIVVCPCVSPWAYEHIQRWQADLSDPNRSFQPDDESEQTEESKALMTHIQHIQQEVMTQKGEKKESPFWKCHLDLHETTDTDVTEFRPAKRAKAGLPPQEGGIPDGFYLVADSTNPQLEFQKAVIDKVKQVTHIAPADDAGTILDEPVVEEGIIRVPARELGLCGGVTLGEYTTTTEVYPDSPKATAETCNQAQVAAIIGGLDYILSQS
ncbi:unnamed protein product [Cylindrotheca closterium]|uniref:Succinylglutamate desuccinylase/Aspartoacylase catalytic domain-containing protein n=1 Tax=Cylindrotheca closterium TaxID=2856 RepID=A0AAD2CGH7_9STRA|nr:unnamed protein product [Cylindrotheca closterium]